MQNLEQLVSDQNKKISDLLALNGDLVHRLSTSKQANEKSEAAFLQISAQIAALETTSSKSVASLQRELSVLKDNGAYLDSTVSHVKTLVDDFADEINKIAEAQQKFIESGLKASEKGEFGRLKGDQTLSAASGRVPSAKDLADLYSSFERKVFELRSTDQFLMLVRAITEELACELAYLAHRLASHIALAADIELMAAKIRHHHSPDPVKMSPDTAPVTDETRSVVAVRDSFLFSFMDEFNALVDAMPPCPLSVRTDARALFARRFLSIFDLALRKLSPVIRNLSSGFDPASAPPYAAATSFSDDDAVIGMTATPSAKSSPRGDAMDNTPPRIGHNDYYMHRTKGAPTTAGALRPLLLSKSQQLDVGGSHPLQLTLQAQRPKSGSGDGSKKAAVHNSGPGNKTDPSTLMQRGEGALGGSVGRPRTAGASRHRSAINDAGVVDSTSRFVLRGGFRMPGGAAAESGNVVHSVLSAAADVSPTQGVSKDVAPGNLISTRRPEFKGNE
jgi:hypothetical protein